MLYEVKRNGIIGNEIVTLAEVKSYMRLTSTIDDSYIDDLIPVAREILEDVLNIAFIQQSFILYLKDYVEDKRGISIPYFPLIEITGITEIIEGEEIPLTDDDFVIYNDNNIHFNSDIYNKEINIEYTAGHGDESNYGEHQKRYKMFLLAQIYYMYENRLSVDVSPSILKNIQQFSKVTLW